jgi:hypothetical protein|uniref:Regulatory protein n=1 Tax=uncultured marine virus TaxID=186617 RepID=A0A0F7L6H0_9VIRU|nr:regulatory protein [uncultured marine virus]
MDAGWIKLHRQILDNPVITKDSDHFTLWIYLLLKATHRPREILFDKQRIKLSPGQFQTGRKVMQKETKINSSKIERILKKLKTEHQIEQQTCSTSRIITILNWDTYQNSEQGIEQRVNSERTTSEHRQEVKELNNLNNHSKNTLKSSDNSNPPTGQKLSAQKQKDLILKDQFNQARLKFPGTKRGLDVEFDYLKKTHKKTWREIIPELLPAINNRIEVAQMKGYNQEFFAEWAHFKTYIFNSKWTESFGEVKSYFTGR